MLVSGLVQAQDRGQVCARIYADHDNNGLRGSDEPLISEGVGVELLTANGVTMAAGLLAQSPLAAEGILCFEGLANGDYSLRLTSAAYVGTGATDASANVDVGSAPPLLDLGARPLIEAESSFGAAYALDGQMARDLLLALGALTAALLLAGCVLALLIASKPRRSRSRPLPAAEGAGR